MDCDFEYKYALLASLLGVNYLLEVITAVERFIILQIYRPWSEGPGVDPN